MQRQGKKKNCTYYPGTIKLEIGRDFPNVGGVCGNINIYLMKYSVFIH